MSIQAVQSASSKSVESQATRPRPVEKAEKPEPVRAAVKNEDAPKPKETSASDENPKSEKSEASDSKIDIKA